MEIDPYSHRQGIGWLMFAWIIMGAAGLMNVAYGISALVNSDFFVANARFVFGDLRTWGWIVLIFGVLEILVALSIWRGGSFGRFAGILIAVLNILAQMGSMQSYPFWSLLIIGFDILVIYALAVYGGHARES